MSGVPTTSNAGRPARYQRSVFFSRQQLWLIAATALVVAAGLVGVVAVARALKPPRSKTADNSEQTAVLRQAERLPEPAIEEADADEDDVEDLRGALGTLTSVNIEQASLNIGLLADGVEGEVYSVAAARKTLDKVSALLDTTDLQLEELPAKAFTVRDRKRITQARNVLRLLQVQTVELRAYWNEKDKDAADRFQKARAEAEKAIKELHRRE
jgi:hypothetical protein